MRKEKINNSIIGMSGVFKDDGYFYIIDNLKTYKMMPHRVTDMLMVMGIKGGNILISSDGCFVSMFPKKYTKIIRQK